MSVTSTSRVSVSMRITPSALDVIDEAATAQGLDRTAFVVDAAVSRARTVLVEEKLRVTATEVEQIRRLLADAPNPTDQMREAARRLESLGL